MDALTFSPPRTAAEARVRAAELWQQQVRMLLAYCDMRDLAETMARQEHEAALERRDLRVAREYMGASVYAVEDG